MLLLLLWVIPLAVAVVSRRYARTFFWRSTGVALGLVVSPASQGLYALYFVGPVAAIAGMLGLILTLLHSWPGYDLSVAMGLIPSHSVVVQTKFMPVEGLNALIWAAVYGGLGWIIDVRSSRRRRVDRNAV
jgi:ABC-type molybdate transport system permease subunit